jgi:hypothetical protein
MKLVILLIFLTSCTDKVSEVHILAKHAARDNKVCYTVEKPDEIKGYYCLHYIGKTE